MNPLNSLTKSSHETFNNISPYEKYPVPNQDDLMAYQLDVGITLGTDDVSAHLVGVQILTEADDYSLSIKVVINLEDEDNSVTASFNHQFIDGFDPSVPMQALLDARAFVLSLCENQLQVKAIETVLFSLVGECLFESISKSQLVQQALVRMMVDNSI